MMPTFVTEGRSADRSVADRSVLGGCRGFACFGAGLSDPADHRGRALPGRRTERRRCAHRCGKHVEDARPADGHRECRRRRRHHRQRARRGGGAGRLHLARRQHGLARLRAGADAGHQVQFGAGFCAGRIHRARARGRGRPQGLPGQEPERVRAVREEERQQDQAGARRHRRLLAHGVLPVQQHHQA